MANDATKVTFGKPKVGGAIFWAPLGTTLPAGTDADLDNAFVCLGYASEDGLKENLSPSTETIPAWGGDIVAVVTTERETSYSFKLIEALNVNVLKAVFGEENVSGTLATGITVNHNSNDVPASCWVVDMIGTDGVATRKVIPNGKISEIGEISHVDNEVVGYEVTITAMPGDSAFGYNAAKTYIKQA